MVREFSYDLGLSHDLFMVLDNPFGQLNKKGRKAKKAAILLGMILNG